jgi:hypothetical protein
MCEHEKKAPIGTLSSAIPKIEGDLSLINTNTRVTRSCMYRYASQGERPLLFRGPFALADVIEPPSHLRQVANLLTADL